MKEEVAMLALDELELKLAAVAPGREYSDAVQARRGKHGARFC